MGRPLAQTLACLAYLLATTVSSERRKHYLQHGSCSYTFILPEVDCHPQKEFSDILQMDSPPGANADKSRAKHSRVQQERPSWQEKKLESLESAMENNTQWLQKVKFVYV